MTNDLNTVRFNENEHNLCERDVLDLLQHVDVHNGGAQNRDKIFII